MSDDSKRRRGQASRYLLGRENALMGPSEPDDRFGPYKPEQLIRMNKKFATRLERAFQLGPENRNSASNQQRADAEDRDRMSLAG